MQYATITCPTMLLCKLANICGLNHNKYISYEYWNLQIYEIETIRNTKFWVTPRCPSHRCQMRRGTPLTRYWFMPALHTQRFATVLTHQLTCFRIPLLCDCLSILCAIWDTKWSQLWHLRVSIFSPNSFAFIKFNYTDLKIRLFHNDVSASLI